VPLLRRVGELLPNVEHVVFDENSAPFVLPTEVCCPVKNRETKPISRLLGTLKCWECSCSWSYENGYKPRPC
jgi:hypothetical protein